MSLANRGFVTDVQIESESMTKDSDPFGPLNEGIEIPIIGTIGDPSQLEHNIEVLLDEIKEQTRLLVTIMESVQRLVVIAKDR